VGDAHLNLIGHDADEVLADRSAGH